jgi:hypothetical protein
MIAFLNLDNESNFLIAMSSLFHSLSVEGINDELVIESLQKGTITLSSFRKGYIVVLCPHFKLKDRLRDLVQLCFIKKNGQRRYKNMLY